MHTPTCITSILLSILLGVSGPLSPTSSNFFENLFFFFILVLNKDEIRRQEDHVEAKENGVHDKNSLNKVKNKMRHKLQKMRKLT